MTRSSENVELILFGWVDALRHRDPELIASSLAHDMVWQGLRPTNATTAPSSSTLGRRASTDGAAITTDAINAVTAAGLSASCWVINVNSTHGTNASQIPPAYPQDCSRSAPANVASA